MIHFVIYNVLGGRFSFWPLAEAGFHGAVHLLTYGMLMASLEEQDYDVVLRRCAPIVTA